MAGTAPGAEPPGDAPPSAPAFNLADLFALLRRRLTTILGVAAVVIGITTVVVMMLPLQYASTAQIMLDQRKNKVTDLSAVVSDLPTDPASVQNQIQVLGSRSLADRVIEKLKLDNDPEFGGGNRLDALLRQSGPAKQRARDTVIDAFLRHLSVESLGLSTTLTVTFTAHDPQRAALIANAIADAYVEAQVDAKLDATRQTVEWLDGRIEKLAEDEQSAEGAVQQFKARYNLSESSDGVPLTDQQVAAVSVQLVQMRAALAEREATSNRVKTMIDTGHAADISQVVASPVIVQLRQQEVDVLRQVAELSSRYGPMHPKMIAIESERKNLAEKITMEVNRVSESVANDVAVARAQVESLEQSLASTQRKATDENLVRVRLKSLQANAESTRTAYEAFVSRLREAQDQEAMQMPDASVISRAPVPDAPSSPKRKLLVGASIPAGLLLGLLVALATDAGAGATLPQSQPQAPRMPAAPARREQPFILAELPDLARQGTPAAMAVDHAIYYPASPFARAIAGLEARLFARRKAGASVVAITAPHAGDGKSVVAISLARAAARRGLKVVLIDGDPWPSVARTMRLGAAHYGLADVLRGTAALSLALTKDPLSNALILPSAHGGPRAGDVLRSHRMRELIVHLRRSADVVILDAPPSDTPGAVNGFAGLVDSVVLLAGWNGSPPQAMAEAHALLTQASPAPVGVVIAR